MKLTCGLKTLQLILGRCCEEVVSHRLHGSLLALVGIDEAKDLLEGYRTNVFDGDLPGDGLDPTRLEHGTEHCRAGSQNGLVSPETLSTNLERDVGEVAALRKTNKQVSSMPV